MKKSLNFRLLAWAAASILIVSTALTTYSAISLKEELFEKAELESKKYAEDVAAEIEYKISQAFEVTRSFARNLAQMKSKENPLKANREEIMQMMKAPIPGQSNDFWIQHRLGA